MARVFLVRSCQNGVMRSYSFDVQVPETICTQVEGKANNYMKGLSINFVHVVDEHEKTNF